MTFLTAVCLRRRSVTILAVILVLVLGVFAYGKLQVELFPEIDFPLVTVITFYPSANPEAVARDVSIPIENSISGVEGLENIQSVSSENLSLLTATFKFGTDMSTAASEISSRLNSIALPSGVGDPTVVRINPDEFPVLQLSVLGDRSVSDLQQIVESQVIPSIVSVEGVFSAGLSGGASRQLLVTVDASRMAEYGLSFYQITSAIQDNDITLPAGSVTEAGKTFPVRTSHKHESIEDLSRLLVGFTGGVSEFGGRNSSDFSDSSKPQPVLLSYVADLELGMSEKSSITRTNGLPSLGISIVKEPDANTVEVTQSVLNSISSISDILPPDVSIEVISNDGPAIQAQIDTLQREAMLGFVIAIAVVFVFLVTLRPTVLRGLSLTIRPTLVIGLSIPLSILTGVLLMWTQGMSLNFMTLGGLAISVGRVVDDSIVVLENVYRHIQRGDNRYKAALDATREVGPAITASTLTTMVVFAPLAFIQGLVGSFFLPFAMTISFALAGSLIVALTAVPVLGSILVRPGDIPEEFLEEDEISRDQTWMQRAYTPVLTWSLRHKLVTLLSALLITLGSFALIGVIPINLFSGGGDRSVSVDIAMPPGTAINQTLDEVKEIERTLADYSESGFIESYLTTIGSSDNAFSPGRGGFAGGSSRANIFIRISEAAPQDIANRLRRDLDISDRRTVNIEEISDGPPTSGLDIVVTGTDYGAISSVASEIVSKVQTINGIENVTSNVAESREEVVIDPYPSRVAAMGLTTRLVAFQISQFIVGQKVAKLTLDGQTVDVVLKGRPEDVDTIDKVKKLSVSGPISSAPLENIAEVVLEDAPVNITRSSGKRSANITGAITGSDTQSIGILVQEKIDELKLPPGVEVKSGGVFDQIAEGFQDIFLAMAIGIMLVYLVMAAGLGALRNPFVIIMSLPLAMIGALVALAITGRTLGLPAMMGILLLVGIVVTNAIVLIAFVEQLRERGVGIYDALIMGGRVRLRPIMMTAFTTSFALLPLATLSSTTGGILGSELATVVIGGLMSSTFLTLLVIPVVYTIMHQSVPSLFKKVSLGRDKE